MPDLPLITAIATGATIILHMGLAFRISLLRRTLRQSLGDGDHPALTARIRGHANLAENAPIVLLTLALLEWLGASATGVALLAALFLTGRLLHIKGLEMQPNSNPFRMWGALSNLFVGVVGGAWLLLTAAMLF